MVSYHLGEDILGHQGLNFQVPYVFRESFIAVSRISYLKEAACLQKSSHPSEANDALFFTKCEV